MRTNKLAALDIIYLYMYVYIIFGIEIALLSGSGFVASKNACPKKLPRIRKLEGKPGVFLGF